MGKFDYSASRSRLLEIAYESSSDSLTQQRADLRAVRGQASIIAAVSGLIGTLFVRLSLEAADAEQANLFIAKTELWGFPLSVFLAVICFVGSIAFSIRILLPSRGWQFETSVETIISKLEKRGPAFDEISLLRVLALDKERRFEKNEELMASVQSYLFFAACLAFAQIPFWCFTIISIGD